jgi:carboxypeptidase PM20D1
MKKALLAAALVLGLLFAVVALQTARLASRQIDPPPAVPLAIDPQAAAARLAKALTFRTVSYQSPVQFEPQAFHDFHAFLRSAFPRAHAALQQETVSEFSLLYTWPGSDPTAAPILLTAHMDVVPVENEATWSHPPFAGRIADDHIWGRGALDDKVGVLGILEAIESLVESGYAPQRTVLIAFGHDEEIGGAQGAARMSALLKQRKITPAYILDEGGAVLTGVIGAVVAPVATVGVAEKGYLTLELKVEAEGGHSMRPPRETVIGVLSAAIERLQNRPFPSDLRGATRSMFEYLAPEMPLAQRAMFANLWLFGALVERRLSASPGTDATIRTTIAPTMFHAGAKENVLPGTAQALVNFRILPGDSVQDTIERVRQAIADPRVVISVVGKSFEPSPVSDAGAQSFELLARTVRQIFPQAVVAPYLVIGATDARHYAEISANIYRFLPLEADSVDLSRIHGRNERISVKNYAKAIQFYAQLIRNSA